MTEHNVKRNSASKGRKKECKTVSDRTRGKGTTKSAMKGRYRECQTVSDRTKGKVRLCKEKRLTECKTVSDRRVRQ